MGGKMTAHTANPFIEAISWGGWQWLPYGGPVVLNVYFDDDYSTWLQVEKDAYLAAFQAWADVTNITVVEVTDESQAQFVAHAVSYDQMTTLTGLSGVFGFHDTPEDAAGTGQVHGYFNYESYSYPASGWVYDPAGLAPGGFGYRMMMHEIGHGLGFAHPHDDGGGSGLFPGVTNSGSYGDNELNQQIYTIMSYNRGWEVGQDPEGAGLAAYGYNVGLGAFDIALAQYYYGAATDFNTGDTTYIIPEAGGWLSIWDAGGTDTIRYNGSADAVINLNSATLDNSPTGGGPLSYLVNDASNSYFGGFTIAADFTDALANQATESGVIIENAIGGKGNDSITGNGVANKLLGRGGADTIDGLRGDDTIRGGNGKDTLNGGFGNDTLLGDGARDKIIGGWGSDVLKGGSGNDVLNGARGDIDRMWGGAGRDAFIFRDGFGSDRIMDFEDDLDTIRLDDNLWVGNLTVQQVLDQFGSEVGNNIVLDFGGGDRLLIRNVADIDMLVDDIMII